MSPRLQVSRVSLTNKWDYPIIKHRNVKLYWITEQLFPMVVSIYPHSMALLKEKKVTFCNSIISFFDSSSFHWWIGLIPNQLLRFSKMDLKWEIVSRKAYSFSNVVLLPGWYFCSTSGFAGNTWTGQAKVSPATSPETACLSRKARCKSLRQAAWKTPQEEWLRPILYTWWCTSQMFKKKSVAPAAWALRPQPGKASSASKVRSIL